MHLISNLLSAIPRGSGSGSESTLNAVPWVINDKTSPMSGAQRPGGSNPNATARNAARSA
jgi:hypothetical protein